MAKYKIKRYRGRTKIEDTKTGKSQEIDIERFMKGGYKEMPKYALGTTSDCNQLGVGTQAYKDCMAAEAMGEHYMPENKMPLQEETSKAREERLQKEALEMDSVWRGNYDQTQGLNNTNTNEVTSDVSEVDVLSDEDYFRMMDEKESQESFEKDYGNYEESDVIGQDPLQRFQQDTMYTGQLDKDLRDQMNASNESNQDTTQRLRYDPRLTKAIRDRMGSSDESNQDTDQMFNPYATVDIPGAAYLFGQSLKNKDKTMTGLAGTKLLTGLGRNIFSGVGNASRTAMSQEEAERTQRLGLQKFQSFEKGGMKDSELATGEYITGIENENLKQPNAEVEAGEYLKTIEGQTTKVVGKKHSQGGEKIEMQEGDRVLTDKLKVGRENAKYLSEKLGAKIGAKDTYSKVLDKFKRKYKLKDVIEEEASLIEKIDAQQKVKDKSTSDMNLQVLSQMHKEIMAKKEPLKQMESELYDELYEMQEASKGNKKPNEEANFSEGGEMLKSLADEYGVPLERAQELINQYSKGGKYPKYELGSPEGCPEGHVQNSQGECVPIKELTKEEANALDYVPEGQSRTEKGLHGKVTPETYAESLKRNSWYFESKPDFNPEDEDQVKAYQEAYNAEAKRLGAPLVEVDGKWGEQTNSISLNREYKYNQAAPRDEQPQVDEKGDLVYDATMFPGESPLPPSGLRGTLKPDRNYREVTPTELEVEPYLRDIKNREIANQVMYEGVGPNAALAGLAQSRNASNEAELKARNTVDAQNLQSQEKANYTNTQIVNRQEDADWSDRLLYEMRNYKAESMYDNRVRDYFNQAQAVNTQRFDDIQNLNLVNASQEDVFYNPSTGRYERRKGSSNKEITAMANSQLT